MSTVLRNVIVISAVIAVHMVLIYMLAFGLKQVSASPQLITVTLQTALVQASANNKEGLTIPAAPVDEVKPEATPESPVKKIEKEPAPQKQAKKPPPTKVSPVSETLTDKPPLTPLTSSSTQTTEEVAQPSEASSQIGTSSSKAASGQTAAKSGSASEAQGATGGSDVTAPSHSAAYLNNAQPVYPSLSRRLGEEGIVLLRTLVSAKGTAITVEIKRSSGHKRLDQAALNAVKRWRFIPAKDRGTPIDMWHDVPIQFSLKDV